MSGLEVVAAFGALSSFLQIADFTAKVAKHAHELNTWRRDATKENQEAAKLARDYEWLGTVSKDIASDPNLSSEEQTIAKLGQQCHDEAQDLLHKLEGLRITDGAKGARRVAESARQAVRAQKESKKIEQRRKYLLELNDQLSTALLQACWSKQRREGSDGDTASAVACALQLAQSKNVRDKKIVKRILQGLSFADIDTRRQRVQQAYSRTYRWAVENERHGLRTWLANGDGIFWISGKAGAGKSTLLKFLSEDQETRSLLRTWSAEQDLVVGSFYFWFLGSELQKSTQGLLQTLLYQILIERPALAHVACPKIFGTRDEVVDGTELRGGLLKDLHWTIDQLVEGFYAIARHQNNGKSKKFCLFIDGLDEFHGNHLELISLLRALTQNGDIKLCVTSRPWNPFRRAFQKGTPTLRLEDLSFPDIRLYVESSFRDMIARVDLLAGDRTDSDSEDEDNYQSQVTTLTDEIAVKAEGVFLWVFLVVRNVLAGFAEGDPIGMLRRRVASFSADLEKFFRDILNRVDDEYQQHTAQMLKLALIQAQRSLFEIQTQGAADLVCWVDFWSIAQDPHGLQDSRFPYNLSIRELRPGACSKMLRDTQLHIGACCKDLLIPPRFNGEHTVSLEGKVEFLHRTVYEFLTQGEMQVAINEGVPSHFNDFRILHLLTLAREKLILPTDLVAARLAAAIKSSLLESHQDRCPEYAAHFDSLLLYHWERLEKNRARHPSETKAELAPRLQRFVRFELLQSLVPLVAFGATGYATAILQSRLAKGRPPIHNSDVKAQPLLQTILGQNAIRPFGTSDISPALLETTLHFYDACDSIQRANPHHLDAWTTFLSKWASEQPVLTDAGLRHVWEIAEVFLSSKASERGETNLAGHWLRLDNVQYTKQFYTAENFIKRSVPEKWADEIDWNHLQCISDRYRCSQETSLA